MQKFKARAIGIALVASALVVFATDAKAKCNSHGYCVTYKEVRNGIRVTIETDGKWSLNRFYQVRSAHFGPEVGGVLGDLVNDRESQIKFKEPSGSFLLRRNVNPVRFKVQRCIARDFPLRSQCSAWKNFRITHAR